MKAFQILPDEDGWPQDYCINASHRWTLPGVRCDQCGFVGGVAGVQYPAFSLPSDVDADPYLDSGPVTPECQSDLQAPLQRMWGQEVQLSPGTEFGPLIGKAWGKCGDVAWVNSGTPLVTAHAVEGLRELGVASNMLVPTELKWRSKTAPEYLELHIPAGLRLAPAYLSALGASRCIICGVMHFKAELPDRAARLAYAELENDPVLDAASLPLQWDLLRIQDWGGTIVASERFKIAAIKLGLTNIVFREIKIVGAGLQYDTALSNDPTHSATNETSSVRGSYR